MQNMQWTAQSPVRIVNAKALSTVSGQSWMTVAVAGYVPQLWGRLAIGLSQVWMESNAALD